MQTLNPQCHCSKKNGGFKNKNLFSFVPGLLIALIPKCPFCILTYTSAITVCSSKSIGQYTPHWSSWISIAFAALTLIITLYNYKGQRTLLATAFVSTGSILIIYSELFSGLLPFYYWGCGLLIFGVWVNGSLPFFLRKAFSFLNRLSFMKVHG